ncbi:hypothetical protein FSARC_4563 [Fusarium sarcochroum]|uniref:DUF2235 domain-containing protein n=1 Tax=Fusarium sarcochroum TaxID=1208366 RepID=A0A8H4U1N9_9HYPO|nr:hypothetical protein FSARC_4563 [Fusarium sarcochroum]
MGFLSSSRSSESDRQRRLLVAEFHGTWAGSVLIPRKTVAGALTKLISESENMIPIHVNGVGSDISKIDRLIGGLCGWGTLRNVITTYSAWAARELARVIDAVGLPEDRGDENFFNLLYNAYDNNPRPGRDILDEVVGTHKSWPDVKIDALCCFDTVGSLGLPLFGVAKPLSRLQRNKKRSDEVSRVTKMFFPGNHGHMGWLDHGEGFAHAPLAWMIQQLELHLGIRFDDVKLKEHFPKYSTGAQVPGADPDWYTGDIPRPNPLIRNIMGTKDRQPGLIVGPCQDCVTESMDNSGGPNNDTSASSLPPLFNIQVHAGARLMNKTAAVPGYRLHLPTPTEFYWTPSDAKASEPGPRRSIAPRIDEATMGPLEASLLGMKSPVNFVTTCCDLPKPCTNPPEERRRKEEPKTRPWLSVGLKSRFKNRLFGSKARSKLLTQEK